MHGGGCLSVSRWFWGEETLSVNWRLRGEQHLGNGVIREHSDWDAESMSGIGLTRGGPKVNGKLKESLWTHTLKDCTRLDTMGYPNKDLLGNGWDWGGMLLGVVLVIRCSNSLKVVSFRGRREGKGRSKS